jgi:hypothetical protein
LIIASNASRRQPDQLVLPFRRHYHHLIASELSLILPSTIQPAASRETQ